MKSIVTGMSLDDGRRMVWVWGLHGNSFHCDACGTSCPQSVCLLRTSYSVRVPKHWLALPWRCCYWGPRCKKTLTFKVRWENSRRCYTLFDAVFPNSSVEAGSGLKIWNKELRLPENDFPPEILSSEGKSAVHPVPKVGRPGLQWQPAFEDLMQTYASKIFLSSLLKQFKQVPASRTPLAPHPGRSTRAVPNSRLEAPELHTSAPAQPLLSVCFAYRDA